MTTKKSVCPIDDINSRTHWKHLLANVDTVIHCAARTPSVNKFREEELGSSGNKHYGTLRLAKEASESGVKRFIFISSVKVFGENTNNGSHAVLGDKLTSLDPYGFSKAKAEAGLLKISKANNMEIVIIRSPVVYGPNVKGNIFKLAGLISLGIPLPLLLIKNKRSLVSLRNLVDFIVMCAEHPKAADQTFFVSDGQDLSTPELLRAMAHAMGKRVLFSFSTGCFDVFS